MNPLRSLVPIGLLVSAILIAVIKGSRAPQPVEGLPNRTRRRILAAFVPVVCAGISGVTFGFVIPWYVSFTDHRVPSFPWLLRAAMFVCGVLPWFVGTYYGFQVSRAAHWAWRTIGAVEVAVCALFGAALLIAFAGGVR
jgi:hypothetical protein